MLVPCDRGEGMLARPHRRRDDRRAPVMLPPSTGEDGISTAAAAAGWHRWHGGNRRASMMLPSSPDKDGISSAVAPVAPGRRTLKKRWRRHNNRRAPVMLPPSTDEDGISTAAAAVKP